MGWGDGFLDYDNDGWLDLFEVNGHVYPQVDQHDWGTTFAERPLLFHNVPLSASPPGHGQEAARQGPGFEYIKPVKGTGLAVVVPARGAAFGDLFNDGKIDVIINPIDGPPVLLKNVNPDHHHWVEMKLVGGGKEPTRRHLRHRLSEGQRHAACARMCCRAAAIFRPMTGVCTSAWAMRPMPAPPRSTGPRAKSRSMKLPAVDRIYTIEEGNGITAAHVRRQGLPGLHPGQGSGREVNAVQRIAILRTWKTRAAAIAKRGASRCPSATSRGCCLACIVLDASRGALTFSRCRDAPRAASSTQSRTLAAKPKPQSGMGGISSAGTFAPAYDAQKRPITAGGFVDKGPIVFQDVTKARPGLLAARDGHAPEEIHPRNRRLRRRPDRLRQRRLARHLPGQRLDLRRAERQSQAAPHAALFHNNHDGTFTDVAAKAGVTNDRWGFGVAVATTTTTAGPTSSSATTARTASTTTTTTARSPTWPRRPASHWATGPTAPPGATTTATAGSICSSPAMCTTISNHQPTPDNGSRGVCLLPVSRRPGDVRPARPAGRARPPVPQQRRRHVYRRERQGRRGGRDRVLRLHRIFVDVNNDGKVDLLVANDSKPNYLYLNKGDGTFEDQSYVSGFALNKDGREIASMGMAVGDYDNNGLVDLVVTDFSDDYKALYRNDGEGSFTDVADQSGITQAAIPFVGWGDGFLDFDNDGWKDIMMINGHVYPQVDEHDWGTTFAERPLLFRNTAQREIRIRAAGERLGAGGADSAAARLSAISSTTERSTW